MQKSIYNSMRNYRWLAISVWLTLPIGLVAQQDSTLNVEELEVVKSFEVKLEDSESVTIAPVIEQTAQPNREFNYKVSILPLAIDYPPPVIKPLALEPDKLFDSYKGFARLSYGSVKNPIANLRYNLVDKDLYHFGFFVDYFGLDNSKKVANQKMSSLTAGAKGKYRVLENTFLNAGVKVDADSRNFYNRDLSPEIKRNTNIIQFDLGIENVEETTAGIDYKVGFSPKFLSATNVDVSETAIDMVGEIKKKSNENLSFVLKVLGSLTSNSLTDDGASVFALQPQAIVSGGKFNAHLGFNVINDNTLSTKFWPAIDFSYALAKTHLQLLLGSKQYFQNNNIIQTNTYCPWINHYLYTLTNSVHQEAFGGVRGEFSYLSYQIKGGYRKSYQQPFFVYFLGSDAPNLLSQDVSTIFFKADVDFAVNKIVTIGANIQKNFYKTDLTTTLYGMPSLAFEGWARVNFMEERLQLLARLNIADKVQSLFYGFEEDDEVITLNNQIELGANLMYAITPNIKAFGQVDNVLNNKYQRWYGLPVVGINASIGVVLKI